MLNASMIPLKALLKKVSIWTDFFYLYCLTAFWHADTHFIISCAAKKLPSMFGFSSTKTVVTAQVFSKDLAICCNII
jgi:hypothetical protein